jgi:hypothetical protein
MSSQKFHTFSLSEYHPGADPADFLSAISDGQYAEGPLDDIEASSEFRDLLANLIRPVPGQRLTAAMALQHPFYAAERRSALADVKEAVAGMTGVIGDAEDLT